MKAIIPIILVMLMLPIVLADVEIGSRVTVYDEEDQPILNHNGYFDIASTNDNEVAVCTTIGKDSGYIVASLKDRELIGLAISKARVLYATMSGAGGYAHFGCVRVIL